MKWLVSGAFLASTAFASAQLTDIELRGLDRVLYVGNLERRDLDFARLIVPPRHAGPLETLALSQPISAAERLMDLHTSTRIQPLYKVLGIVNKSVYGDPAVTFGEIAPATVPDTVPEAVRVPVGRIIAAVQAANLQVKQALSKLTDTEKRILIESIPTWAAAHAQAKFSFVSQQPLPMRDLQKLLAKVDLATIRRAAESLSREIELTNPDLLRNAQSMTDTVTFAADGMKVILGGNGNDRHDATDAALVIDFGGNDTYMGRHGAGIAGTSVLIDLAGDDTYDVQDASVGCGILGIGIAYDLSGNDRCIGDSLTFGAGVAGVGAFVNVGGNDSYDSQTLSQGFGAFGVGILLDSSGADVYRAASRSQGSSRTGGTGWLMDRGGNDFYSLKNGYGQAYAEGVDSIREPLSGGVALLSDFGGSDIYDGRLRCQAASRYHGTASLYDQEGDDAYRAADEAQSSARDRSSAYLVDLAGDDTYHLGAAGTGQAMAHGASVALLLDRAGADTYTGRPAMANAGGLSLFIDSAGNDRYLGSPGSAFASSSSDSLSLFVDLGGRDVYAATARDGLTWAKEELAFGSDMDLTGSVDAIPPSKQPVPGSVATPTAEGMRQLFSYALAHPEAGANGLIAVGMPAVTWIVQERLATADRDEITIISNVVDSVGAEARRAIANQLDGVPEKALAALWVLAELRAPEARPHLQKALDSPLLVMPAIQLAGRLGAREALPQLMRLAASENKVLAAEAVGAMAMIKDMQAITTLQAVSGSGDFYLRRAAIRGLMAIPLAASSWGNSLITRGDERLIRTGIELLRSTGDVKDLDAIGQLLSSEKAGVRISALLALNGKTPPAYRARMLELRSDVDPLVRSVAESVSPGR